MLTLGTLVCTLGFLISLERFVKWTPHVNHEFTVEPGTIEYRYGSNTWGKRAPTVGWKIKPALRRFEIGDLAPDWHSYPNSWFVRLPFWIPGALCFIPASWLWIWRFRFKRPGVCSHCGYRLEGLPAKGSASAATIQCPECGTKATA